MMSFTKRVVIAGLTLLLTSCGSSPAAQPSPAAPPPVPAGVAMATDERVPIQVRAVGNAEPFASVGVKAQISGPLLSVKFTEGANVKAGELLFEIDSRPFREALRQAESTGKQHDAELKVAEANLARSRAQLKNAQADAVRFEQLSREGISTRMQEEQIRTAAEVATQTVRADEAAIEGIRARLETNDRAIALGVTPEEIQNALYTSYGDRQVSNIYAPANQYSVILEVRPEDKRAPAALDKLRIRSSKGQLVSLDGVAEVKRSVGPLSVNHFGQQPAATVSFNLKPGFSLGEAAKSVDAAIRELRIPISVTTSFQGTVKEFQESFQNLTVLLVVAILVIYIVLGVLYESFIHPITILSGLPSAVFGALLTLALFGKQLDLFAFVGLIMLFGVVKKNAIMMIDFAIEARRVNGKSPEEAIYQGCTLRFRPIMMTTMAALLGTLPIALGYGEGADARQPLGLAVVGGLLVSQFLTLYITPVIYLYLEQLQVRLQRRNAS
jgi:multidrug efflux pump subunit AcrB